MMEIAEEKQRRWKSMWKYEEKFGRERENDSLRTQKMDRAPRGIQSAQVGC